MWRIEGYYNDIKAFIPITTIEATDEEDALKKAHARFKNATLTVIDEESEVLNEEL